MANAEENPNANIVFRGIDGNECEAFIIAIRDLAFAKGKEEDCHWMLHHATTRLRHKALRWHAKLDPSIRKDWDLFVQALFEEYPLVEAQDEGGIATPVWTSTTLSPTLSNVALPGDNRHLATTKPPGTEVVAQSSTSLPPNDELVPPTRLYDSSLPGYQIGRLLFIYEAHRPGSHYISTSNRATSNIHEALIVTFIPSSEPHHIGCFNRGETKLGVNLWSPEVSELHNLTYSFYSDEPISISTNSCQGIYEIWSISPDGTLKATLPDLVLNGMKTGYIPSELYSTTSVFVEISGTSASFAKDYITPRARHHFSNLPLVRARIVFEPL